MTWLSKNITQLITVTYDLDLWPWHKKPTFFTPPSSTASSPTNCTYIVEERHSFQIATNMKMVHSLDMHKTSHMSWVVGILTLSGFFRSWLPCWRKEDIVSFTMLFLETVMTRHGWTGSICGDVRILNTLTLCAWSMASCKIRHTIVRFTI